MNFDGTYEWKKQDVDYEFEPWDVPKTECYPWNLSEDDMKILVKHGMAKDEVTSRITHISFNKLYRMF